MSTERFFETPEGQDIAPLSSRIGAFGGNLFITGLESLEKGKYAYVNCHKIVVDIGVLCLALVVSFVEVPVNRAVKHKLEKLQKTR